MTAKLLLPPVGRRSSIIVASRGRLRVVDPPRRCLGYQFCCVCPDCRRRAKGGGAALTVATCACERPWATGADCAKCGRALSRSQPTVKRIPALAGDA